MTNSADSSKCYEKVVDETVKVLKQPSQQSVRADVKQTSPSPEKYEREKQYCPMHWIADAKRRLFLTWPECPRELVVWSQVLERVCNSVHPTPISFFRYALSSRVTALIIYHYLTECMIDPQQTRTWSIVNFYFLFSRFSSHAQVPYMSLSDPLWREYSESKKTGWEVFIQDFMILSSLSQPCILVRCCEVGTNTGRNFDPGSRCPINCTDFEPGAQCLPKAAFKVQAKSIPLKMVWPPSEFLFLLKSIQLTMEVCNLLPQPHLPWKPKVSSE
jgi:hypothetical protein